MRCICFHSKKNFFLLSHENSLMPTTADTLSHTNMLIREEMPLNYMFDVIHQKHTTHVFKHPSLTLYVSWWCLSLSLTHESWINLLTEDLWTNKKRTLHLFYKKLRQIFEARHVFLLPKKNVCGSRAFICHMSLFFRGGVSMSVIHKVAATTWNI